MMSEKTHWLKNPNKNYLGHWDLPDNDLILTIKSAGWEDVIDPTKKKGDNGYSQLKRVVHFEEDYKPLICNQTNAKSIYASTGIRFLEDSKGAKIKLFVGEEVDRRNKITVECVRIRNEKVIQIDSKPYEDKLKSCRTLDELKEIFLTLPRELQHKLNGLKDELKTKLS